MTEVLLIRAYNFKVITFANHEQQFCNHEILKHTRNDTINNNICMVTYIIYLTEHLVPVSSAV